MAEFDKRLIPNYVFAGATIATFLFACIFALYNADTLITVIEGSAISTGTALVLGGVGGALLTALIVITKDVYQFFFRTSPTE